MAQGEIPPQGAHVSDRWAVWRAAISLTEYDARWERLASAGRATHGEADFIESLLPRSVLDAGCGMGRVSIELHQRGIDVMGIDLDDDLLEFARLRGPDLRWQHANLATVQLDRRFDLVAMPGNVMIFCRPEDRLAIVHTAAQHLHPGGKVVAGFSLESGTDSLTLAEYDALCDACELELVERWATWERAPFEGGDYAVSVHQRSDRFNVHDLLFEARGLVQRVTVHELAASLDSAAPPMLVDVRSAADRHREGKIAGSIHIARTELEWRLDPANGYRHPAAPGFDQSIVVACNDGYSSSLAAANLVRLGFLRVGDVIGGVRAWRAAGLPVEATDR